MTAANASKPGSSASPAIFLLLVFINILWSGSSIAAKSVLGDSTSVAGSHVGPFTLGCIRFGVASLLLLGYLRTRGTLIRVDAPSLRQIALFGALSIGVTYSLFYGALRSAKASESAILIASEPLMVAIIARFALKESLHPVQMLGLIAGFFGVYLIVFQGVVPRITGSSEANAILTLALLVECFAAIIAKRLTSRHSGLVVIALGMGIGALCLLPFAIHESLTAFPTSISAAQIGGILYLALVCSTLCYGVWFTMLNRFDVSAMAVFLFVQPVMGPVLGYTLLGESLSLWTGIGASFVLSGVWLGSVAEAKKRKPA